MRNGLVRTVLGTATVGVPLLAIAAAPMPFDRWSVNNGTITAECVAGVSCRAPMTTPGMLQREINNPSGKYIQSVITNSNATGTAATLSFSSESFVKQGWGSTESTNGTTGVPGESNIITDGGTAVSGIALKQTLTDSGSVNKQGPFSLTTLIHTGWAADSATRTVEIKQKNGPASPVPGATWQNDFWFAQNVDAAGNQTGVAWDIDQVGINMRFFDPIKARESMPQDVYAFSRRRRAGDLNPGRLGGGPTGGSSDNGSSSIPAFTKGGDAVATWFGMFYTGGEGRTSIGYQSYDNLNDTTPGTWAWDKESAPGRPWSWDNMFGVMPTMPVPFSGGKD